MPQESDKTLPTPEEAIQLLRTCTAHQIYRELTLIQARNQARYLQVVRFLQSAAKRKK